MKIMEQETTIKLLCFFEQFGTQYVQKQQVIFLVPM